MSVIQAKGLVSAPANAPGDAPIKAPAQAPAKLPEAAEAKISEITAPTKTPAKAPAKAPNTEKATDLAPAKTPKAASPQTPIASAPVKAPETVLPKTSTVPLPSLITESVNEGTKFDDRGPSTSTKEPSPGKTPTPKTPGAVPFGPAEGLLSPKEVADMKKNGDSITIIGILTDDEVAGLKAKGWVDGMPPPRPLKSGPGEAEKLLSPGQLATMKTNGDSVEIVGVLTDDEVAGLEALGWVNGMPPPKYRKPTTRPSPRTEDLLSPTN
jgi:hypothetical protein